MAVSRALVRHLSAALTSRGEIAGKGAVGGAAGLRNGGTRSSRLEDLVSPATYLGTSAQAGHEIYALTDDVTDADFDEALTRAQDERNVSRANVDARSRAPVIDSVVPARADGGHHQGCAESAPPGRPRARGWCLGRGQLLALRERSSPRTRVPGGTGRPRRQRAASGAASRRASCVKCETRGSSARGAVEADESGARLDEHPVRGHDVAGRADPHPPVERLGVVAHGVGPGRQQGGPSLASGGHPGPSIRQPRAAIDAGVKPRDALAWRSSWACQALAVSARTSAS